MEYSLKKTHTHRDKNIGYKLEYFEEKRNLGIATYISIELANEAREVLVLEIPRKQIDRKSVV